MYVTTKAGFPFPSYDDGEGGRLFLFRDEEGGRMVVRARSYERAEECFIDASLTVPRETLHECYVDPETGDIFTDPDRFETFVRQADDGLGDYPVLAEGYRMQSSSSRGTGIVSVSHFLTQDETDLTDLWERSIVVCLDDETHEATRGYVLVSFGDPLSPPDGTPDEEWREHRNQTNMTRRPVMAYYAVGGGMWADGFFGTARVFGSQEEAATMASAIVSRKWEPVRINGMGQPDLTPFVPLA